MSTQFGFPRQILTFTFTVEGLCQQNQTQIVLAEFPTWTHTASRIELGLSIKTQVKIFFRTTKKCRTLTKEEGTGLDSFPAQTSVTYVPWEYLEGTEQREHKQDCEGSLPGFLWTWRNQLVTGLFSWSNQPLDKYCSMSEVQNSYSLELGMGLEKTGDKLRIWEGEGIGWLKLVWLFFLMLLIAIESGLLKLIC